MEPSSLLAFPNCKSSPWLLSWDFLDHKKNEFISSYDPDDHSLIISLSVPLPFQLQCLSLKFNYIIDWCSFIFIHWQGIKPACLFHHLFGVVLTYSHILFQPWVFLSSSPPGGNLIFLRYVDFIVSELRRIKNKEHTMMIMMVQFKDYRPDHHKRSNRLQGSKFQSNSCLAGHLFRLFVLIRF